LFVKVIVIHHRSLFAGKRASIRYGTGAISGYFSLDIVKIGDVVVKNQVYSNHHVSYTRYVLSVHVHPFLEYVGFIGLFC